MSSLKNNYDRVALSRKLPIFRPLTDTGLASGSNALKVDGSTTPQRFRVKPSAGQRFTIGSLQVIIADSGAPAYSDYGNLAGPLTNGLTFYVITNGVEIPLTPRIKQNVDWFELPAFLNIISFSNNVRVLSYNIDLFKLSDGIEINGDLGDEFGCQVNDDLSTLILHTIDVGGYLGFSSVG